MLIKFSELLNAKHNGREISVRCIVSGKSVSPYVIPKRIEITCRKGKDCPHYCTMRNKDSVIIDDYEKILKFTDVNESAFSKVIQSIYKIDCDNFTFNVKTKQNIERIYLSAPTGKERIKHASNFACYYIGYGIDTNTMYELAGVQTNTPKEQLATCIFTEAKKIKTDVESFSLTKETCNKLNEFKRSDIQAEEIFNYLTDLYESHASNVTKIYGRMDLHLCLDLLFHSPLAFRFNTEVVHKGWVDTAIIGDTRCGKGYVAENYIKYFGVGEIVSGDNASLAGLIGGNQQYDGRWVATWGKIPLNDGGLIIIDEASKLHTDIWSHLTRVRSEGIAEIVKIHPQITNARARLAFLTNAHDKTISNYSYGIQSIVDVVKAPQDIARFDYVLVVARGEVSLEEINRPHESVPEMYNKDLEQQLILWIWSRKISDIIFSEEAVDRVYALSKALGKRYTSAIPLIQGENVRIKLAKLAICFAGRLYSNKNNGKILYVNTQHVDAAYIFFNVIYSKDCCGYTAMSHLQKLFDNSASKENITSIEHYFRTFHNKRPRLLKCLLNNSAVNSNDLVEHVNITKEISHEIISKLLDKGMIVKRGSMYVKTPSFTTYIKQAAMDEIMPKDREDKK